MNCKKMLRLLPLLGSMVARTDKHIRALALGSMTADTERQIDKIMSWSQYKSDVISLACIIEDAFNSLPTRQRELLQRRIIARKPIDVVAEECGISRRTFFRILQAADKQMESILVSRGFDSSYISERFGDNPLIGRTILKAMEVVPPAPKRKRSVKILPLHDTTRHAAVAHCPH